MSLEEFQASLTGDAPPPGIPVPVQALWWDAKGDWTRAHSLVDALTSYEGMAVHAYLHRKEGADWNASYWYDRAGRSYHRGDLNEEWQALIAGLLPAK